MTALDVELERLLYKREYRRGFDFAAPELAALDRDVLERLAERIAREVLARKHAGSGSLLDVFPGTIGAWRRAHPEDESLIELAYAFLESPEFDRHRDLPFCGEGIALEQAFFEFAEQALLADPVLREREFMAAMIRLLLVSPRAHVALPECIRRVPGGFFAVTARGEPVLFAAVGGRFVHGALTPFLAELLAPGARALAVAARHGVSRPVLEGTVGELSALGLASRLE